MIAVGGLAGAACVGSDPERWFSQDPAVVAGCVDICVSCPLQVRCLAGAVARGEQHGVWGGRTFHAITLRYPPVQAHRMVPSRPHPAWH